MLRRKTNDRNMVALKGQVHPLAIARYDRGPVDGSLPLSHMVLVLKRSAQQDQALTTLIDQLHDAKSPMYHRWLTAEEFGQYFGPSDQDLQSLTTWLEGNGFKVDEVSPGRSTVIFSGNADQVRQAFRTEIHHFYVNGEKHIANASDPQIPAVFAPLVAGFRSLHDFQAKPLHHMVGGFSKDKSTGEWKQSSTITPNLTSLAGPIGDARLVGPQDFYAIYNLKPLLSAGINGAGQTIAVIEQSDVNPADVTAFRAQFGLPAYPSKPNAAQGGVNYLKGIPNYCSDPGIVTAGDEDEAILDVEWAGAIAPNATVDVVSCASSGASQGTDLALTYIVNHLASSVSSMSYSYGACEASLGSASNAFYKSTYQQAVAQGQTVVVSTGDSGAPGCDNFSGPTPNPATLGNAVNGLASTPYNIAAGGTDFSDVYQNLTSTYWNSNNGPGYGSARSYIPETAWNGSCASPLLRSYAAKLGLNPGATPEAWCNNAAFTAKYGSFVFLDGGSGGVSSVYSKPSWQSAYGVPNDSHRDLPDISLFASNFVYSHALAVCQSDRGYSCDMSNSTAAQTMAGGGTSFVAPQVAGLIALVNQKTNARQGQANYTLYALAASEYGSPASPNSAMLNNCNGSAKGNAVATSCLFYDVNAVPNPSGGTITDTISQPCAVGSPNCVATARRDAYGLLSSSTTRQVAAYPTGRGYDLATGLGSINFANLVNGWTVGATSGSTTFKTTTTLNASPTTIPLGGATTLTATVTNSTYASPAGIVNFYAGSVTGRLLGTATLLATRSPAATAVLQVPGISLDPGVNSVVAVFPGDGANDAASASSAVNITVGLAANAKITPSVTLASSAASLSIMTTAVASVGQMATLTATIDSTTATGTFTFSVGATQLGVLNVAGGSASLLIDASKLVLGGNSLMATYSGDGSYNSKRSNTLTVNGLSLNAFNFGSVNIGATSAVQSFRVNFLAPITVGAVNELTQGVQNQDYLDGGTTTCAAGNYGSGAACTLSMDFRPSVPGNRLGSAVLYDASSVPVITLPATGVGIGPLLSFGAAAPQRMTPGLNGPTSILVDPAGNLFVADAINNRVVEIPIANPTNTISVGNGFIEPFSTALDGAGNLYVSDAKYGISIIPNENGIGLNYQHQAALNIPGGLNLPSQINFDSVGNLYIADTFNSRILKLTRKNGVLDVANPTTIGTGLSYPQGVAVDPAGNVFIADTGYITDDAMGQYGRILKVAAGGTSQQVVNITVAGGVYSPIALATDPSGGLYISEANFPNSSPGVITDTGNARILQLTADFSRQTVLETIPNVENGQVFGALAVDLKGNVWVPDFANNEIIKLGNVPAIGFGNPAKGATTVATTPVYNIGNADLNFYSFKQGTTTITEFVAAPPPIYWQITSQWTDSIKQFFVQQSVVGSCAVGTPIAPNSGCMVSIGFTGDPTWPSNYLINASALFLIYDNVNNQAFPGHQETMQVYGSIPWTN